ncbi:MAG: phosphonate ABC transporter, permease protein PhnE [Rhodospirillales bacterium 20-64-7]|nr:MAG: phosphonate ABC transporter, permease protein PhnE [Rhodospirillales bacterium 20-64-7]
MISDPAFALETHTAQPRRPAAGPFQKLGILLALLLVMGQAVMVVQAKPGELISGVHGMADIISRSLPPNFGNFTAQLWPALETVDIGIFGTFFAVFFALPLAVLAARNTTPARSAYYIARSLIAVCRSVPDLVWALLFVTAVGLGPFAGALALTVHSVGMLGRLLAEVIEDMDMGPMDALASTGAGRMQVFSHAVVPTVLPSLMGIALYRLDENIRSSLVLGFVGAGGIGFQLLSAMNLFDYQTVSLLLIMTFVIVIGAERLSAALRKRVT